MKKKKATLVAIVLVMLTALVPTVAFADCIAEGECGSCTEQAPVCCMANAAGVGQCVRFSDNGSTGAGGGNSTPIEPEQSSSEPATKVACRNTDLVPTFLWGMTRADAEANAQALATTGDPCPPTVVKAFILPGWKVQKRAPVK